MSRLSCFTQKYVIKQKLDVPEMQFQLIGRLDLMWFNLENTEADFTVSRFYEWEK